MNQIEIKNEKDIKNFKNKNNIFIVKPEPGSSGVGIKVFNKKNGIKNYINNYEYNQNEKK